MLSALLLMAVQTAPAMVPQDVIVMRRQVTRGTFQGNVWKEGDWTTQVACSETAPATRTVQCVDSTTNQIRPDAHCRGEKPAETGTAPNFAACQYRWDVGSYTWGSTCSDTTYATRVNACVRYGAGSPEKVVDGALCSQPAPATRDPMDPAATVGNYASCAFRWKEVAGACSNAAPVRNISYVCERSGGTSATKDVADADCSGIGNKPVATTTPDASCGPPNLIVDPGMENVGLSYGAGGWSAPAENFTATGRTGRGGVLQGSSGPSVLMPGLANNKPVTVTFWAKCLASSCGAGEIRISGERASINATGQWKQFSVTSTPTNIGFFGNGLQFSGSYTVIIVDDVTATQAN